jgi:hypothetical protein
VKQAFTLHIYSRMRRKQTAGEIGRKTFEYHRLRFLVGEGGTGINPLLYCIFHKNLKCEIEFLLKMTRLTNEI